MNLRTTPLRTAPAVAGRSRCLAVARAVCLVLAVLVLTLNALGSSYAFERYETMCETGVCPETSAGLAPASTRALGQAGLSTGFYAGYLVALQIAATLVFVAVVAVLLRRRSEDRMALVASFTLVVFGGVTLSSDLSEALAVVHPALWFPVRLLDYVGDVAIGTLFYLFPNGDFVPRWTRWFALVWALLFVPLIFFPDSTFNLLHGPLILAYPLSLLAAQVYRYRRVSEPLERQQTKWVVYGVGIAALGYSTSITLGEIVPAIHDAGPIGHLVKNTIEYVCISLIPLSIGVAVLRYRLWAIDPIINRTLVYGALTACVVGLYVLVVGYVGALLKTEGNVLISLVATGVVAVLFAPLRDRIQHDVNRLMYGERDEPYAVISRLGERLEGALAPDAVLPTIVRTVREALKLPYVAIALKEGESFVITAESGTSVVSQLQLPLVYQGETIGELLLAPRSAGEAFTTADHRLLGDLARQAGIAAYAARLTGDLQRARERLVSAREEERRRLRRDLHDGLGPQLSSQTLTVDAVLALMQGDPEAARAMLLDLKAQSQDAVADIRRIVYALRPPALDDLGLVGALRAFAARRSQTGLCVSLEVPEYLPPLPAAVEVAGYRIAQEALTNVARHARARSCVVRLALDEQARTLRLEVEDDGRGIGEDPGSGVGLHSMRERAGELGGECLVEMHPGGGTLVRVRLPLSNPQTEEGQ